MGISSYCLGCQCVTKADILARDNTREMTWMWTFWTCLQVQWMTTLARRRRRWPTRTQADCRAHQTSSTTLRYTSITHDSILIIFGKLNEWMNEWISSITDNGQHTGKRTSTTTKQNCTWRPASNWLKPSSQWMHVVKNDCRDVRGKWVWCRSNSSNTVSKNSTEVKAVRASLQYITQETRYGNDIGSLLSN